MGLEWTASEDPPAGHTEIPYRALVDRFIAPARAVGAQRRTLEPPMQALREFLAAQPGVALTDVPTTPQALADVYGYVAEPCFRLGVPVVVIADQELDAIDEHAAVEPQIGYAWSLQRLRYLAAQAARGPAPAPTTQTGLDPSQRDAVSAHDGVVQIIAPAGSGKTTVLVARAAELVARGVGTDRVLCTTFNRDAQQELQSRLAAAGLAAVRAQTFHSLGYAILKDCRGLRTGEIRTLSLGQWRRLCALAARAAPENDWVEPAIARELVAQVKLGRLLTPREFRRRAAASEQTLVALYELYEQELAALRVNDFDDLIFLALRALQSDAELRERWQERYDHVLVDEYQDIDPAQETLVQILAAPQDGLFSVGDEDQTLYAWRAASVERIVGLDRLYPGLQRVALDHNYRCPPEVVKRSRKLIEHNRSRFPKRIETAPQRRLADDPRPLIHQPYGSLEAAAVDVARKLARARRGEIVVLARTSRLLRMCAEACDPLGVKIAAPENVFEATGARAALQAYCRVLSDVRSADPEDVATVFRHPGRGLPQGAEQAVAGALADGASFERAVSGLGDVPDHARRRLGEGARVLDTALTLIADAARTITFLRVAGGLDEHFKDYEALGGGVERVELEVLQDAVTAAAGVTMAVYAQRLTAQRDALRAIRDDANGVELTTVHRAKGREWPTVIMFGADEDQLPHKRSLEEFTAGNQDAIEAERRVAYVAFTRAQQRLVLLTAERPSRFLVECGLVEAPPPAPEPVAPAPSRSRPLPQTRERRARRPGPATGYELARRAISAPDADPGAVVQGCRSLATARRVLAGAVRSADAPSVERLTGADLADLLEALANVRDEELSVSVPHPGTPISELTPADRRATAEALKP